MLRWLKSIFAWRDVRDQGVWLYQQNAITGQRRAIRLDPGCYQPLDFDWLNAGVGHPKIDGLPSWATSWRRIGDS